MEAILVVAGICLLVGLPVGAILGMVAWSRAKRLTTQVEQLELQVRQIRQLIRQPSTMAPSVPKVAVILPAVQPTHQPQPNESDQIPKSQALTPQLPLPTPAAQAFDRDVEAPLILAMNHSSSVPAAPAPAPEVVSRSVIPATTKRELAPSVLSTTDGIAVIPTIAAAQTPELPAAPSPTAGSSLEAAIGKRWLTWAGVALVFLSGVFLLKYAYDQDWIGHVITPPIRLAGLALAACGMVVVGLRWIRQGMAALGHGLSGGGIAIAYLAVYGGFSPAVILAPEPLFPGQLAFVLMALVTVVGMTLAVRADAVAMAVCAVIGGFATPVLIDTGGGSREALFAYILLLDLGVLGAAWFRRWRILDVVAFAGTAVLYAGWHHSRELSSAEPWAMLVWLLGFHFVFVVLPFAHHWRNRSVVTIERFGLAVGNLAFTLAYAAVLMHDTHQLALALVCLLLAGLYAGIGIFTRIRIPTDHKVGHGFLALGTMLVTLGLFYLLPVEAIATAWTVEAVTLLVLGYRYAHQPTRILAQMVLAIAVFRLAVTRFPATDLHAPMFWSSWFLSLLVAPVGLAATAEVHRRWMDKTGAQRTCWWLAGLLLLIVGSAEIARHADGHPASWMWLSPATMHGTWWAVGGLACFAAAWRWSSSATAHVALLPALLGVVFGLSAYDHTWLGGVPVINPRFALSLFTLAALGWWVRCVAKGAVSDRERLGVSELTQSLLATLVQLGAVLLATLETMSWYGRAVIDDVANSSDGDLQTALTCVWAGMALVGLLTSLATRKHMIAKVALVPLIAAIFAGFCLYFRTDQAEIVFANRRFLALILAVVVVGCQRLIFTSSTWLPTLTQVLTTAALTCELIWWSGDMYASTKAAFAHGCWATALIWAGSAAIAAGRWWRGAPRDARHLAVTLAVLAGLPALATYLCHWDTWLPFLNLRALAPVAVVAALAWVSWVNREHARHTGGISSSFNSWLAVVIGFVSGTCEAPLHFLYAIAEPALAARVATFSITVVWVMMAAMALAIGFRWRLPMVRYLALGLFLLTAAKLVIIDMSGVQQIYRIFSFMLVGMALIGASYAYHRLERRLLAAVGREDRDASPSSVPKSPPTVN